MHDAPAHACQNCTTEIDCLKAGEKPDGKRWYCQAAKDPVGCGAAPAIGVCKKDAPNATMQCKPCSSEQACGHEPDGKTFYCSKNPAGCGGPKPPAPKIGY